MGKTSTHPIEQEEELIGDGPLAKEDLGRLDVEGLEQREDSHLRTTQ